MSIPQDAANRIKRKYGESNPIRLCGAMGINLTYAAMGTNEKSCKGFYLYHSRCKMIVINDQIDENLQRVILAHEIGHSVLHSPLAGVAAYHDFGMFAETSGLEYEANIFAAELLLDDKMVLEELAENDFFDAASILAVPPELLSFKLQLLKHNGYKIDLPMTAKGNFLKRAFANAGE
jgi:Zn-dependent peptidase ImmA (M78 family)